MWDASIALREILVPGSPPARRAAAAPRCAVPWRELKFFPNPLSSSIFLRSSLGAADNVTGDRQIQRKISTTRVIRRHRSEKVFHRPSRPNERIGQVLADTDPAAQELQPPPLKPAALGCG